MKKLLVLALACTMLASCGTVFGGKITECQKHKPTDGTKRKIRPAALVGDLFTGGLWLIIDFVDGGIYKPCSK